MFADMTNLKSDGISNAILNKESSISSLTGYSGPLNPLEKDLTMEILAYVKNTGQEILRFIDKGNQVICTEENCPYKTSKDDETLRKIRKGTCIYGKTTLVPLVADDIKFFSENILCKFISVTSDGGIFCIQGGDKLKISKLIEYSQELNRLKEEEDKKIEELEIRELLHIIPKRGDDIRRFDAFKKFALEQIINFTDKYNLSLEQNIEI